MVTVSGCHSITFPERRLGSGSIILEALEAPRKNDIATTKRQIIQVFKDPGIPSPTKPLKRI